MDDNRSDSALAASLDGEFTSHHAQVNGVRLHYVAGGQGAPLLLLPGWPQTWWQFNQVMPALARHYRVFAVDLRGMGGSAKPDTGYDKKTMARDVYELALQLGHERVNVAGHDIGAMVAQSLTANHPDVVEKVALLDVHHPDETLYGLTLLPQPDQHRDGDILAGSRTYLWWFAMNQVRGLPEALLAGRARELIDTLFDYLLMDPASICERDREIYARAYSSPDAIRAGNAWYQAFVRDIEDEKWYGPLTRPVLALGGAHSNYPYLSAVVPGKGADVKVVEVEDSGHYLPEEQPGVVTQLLTEFFA